MLAKWCLLVFINLLFCPQTPQTNIYLFIHIKFTNSTSLIVFLMLNTKINVFYQLLYLINTILLFFIALFKKVKKLWPLRQDCLKNEYWTCLQTFFSYNISFKIPKISCKSKTSIDLTQNVWFVFKQR